MNPHTCEINIIWGMFQVYGNDHTHFCFHVKSKWYFGQQSPGVTQLIHGINTQLDFGSNMSRIPPGYTSFQSCGGGGGGGGGCVRKLTYFDMFYGFMVHILESQFFLIFFTSLPRCGSFTQIIRIN